MPRRQDQEPDSKSRRQSGERERERETERERERDIREEERERERNKLNLWLGVSERGSNGVSSLARHDGLLQRTTRAISPLKTRAARRLERKNYGQSLGSDRDATGRSEAKGVQVERM